MAEWLAFEQITKVIGEAGNVNYLYSSPFDQRCCETAFLNKIVILSQEQRRYISSSRHFDKNRFVENWRLNDKGIEAEPLLADSSGSMPPSKRYNWISLADKPLLRCPNWEVVPKGEHLADVCLIHINFNLRWVQEWAQTRVWASRVPGARAVFLDIRQSNMALIRTRKPHEWVHDKLNWLFSNYIWCTWIFARYNKTSSVQMWLFIINICIIIIIFSSMSDSKDQSNAEQQMILGLSHIAVIKRAPAFVTNLDNWRLNLKALHPLPFMIVCKWIPSYLARDTKVELYWSVFVRWQSCWSIQMYVLCAPSHNFVDFAFYYMR